MITIKGLFTIKWVEGKDKYGNPTKYQSLVEIIPTITHTITEEKCYHYWEEYKGLLHDDRKCSKCGKVELL